MMRLRVYRSRYGSGTKWDELPDDWVCPLCGAEKADFMKQGAPSTDHAEKPKTVHDASLDMQQLSPWKLVPLFKSCPGM